MRDIPIIMSAPMVQASIREVQALGTGKTETRRMLHTKRTARNGIVPASATILQDHPPPLGKLSPAGWPENIGADQYYALTGWHKLKPGDRLWVRENLKKHEFGWVYAADDRAIEMATKDSRVPAMIAWAHHQERDSVPSIHMPRWASRLTLLVTATKIERLQEMSIASATAEGVELETADPPFYYIPGIFPHSITAVGLEERGSPLPHAVQSFAKLWDYLHGLGAWQENPWVVVIRFRPILANIDAPEVKAA